jgi:hypothetical protein
VKGKDILREGEYEKEEESTKEEMETQERGIVGK